MFSGHRIAVTHHLADIITGFSVSHEGGGITISVGNRYTLSNLTPNYDGQLTGQKGIHSRYESKMFSLYFDSITLKSPRLHKVKNISRYIFDYMYFNYQFKDSLLKADLNAFDKANHEYSEMYYQNLWNQTKGFTTKMIANSSKSLAELIRMAWIEAGRPRLPRKIGFETPPQK
jgi:hypothetical protein